MPIRAPIPLPSYEEVAPLLRYDCDTGRIFWKGHRRGARRKEAGHILQGYRRITVFYKTHMAHRLAWLLYYEQPPEGFIDHIDGDKLNNRISNLRIAEPRGNTSNIGLNRANTSGFKGVYRSRDGMWIARIRDHRYPKYKDGSAKKVFIGQYHTAEEAGAAYDAYAMSLFGDFCYRLGAGREE